MGCSRSEVVVPQWSRENIITIALLIVAVLLPIIFFYLLVVVL
jgi:hypothetical protein